MKTQFVLSGMTSGTGDAVVRRMVETFGPERLLCLVRETSPTFLLHELDVPMLTCDIAQPSSYRDALGPDTIYVDMTHPKYYGASVKTVRERGVERAFWVTTTGIFSKYHSASDIYKRGEETLRDSGVTWTILRPAMIYGSSRDKNMHKLCKFISRSPVFPMFGRGASLMQPVYVDDLADGIVRAITLGAKTEGRDFNLAGPRALPYREIVREVARALNRRVTLLRIPMGAALLASRIGERVPKFPLKHEQVMRLNEDKAFDIAPARRELEFSPREFSVGIRQEVAQLREQGLL